MQPHYFGGALERCDLVVDHHPEQANHNAVFKDIRPDYGSTCTILTEHLRAVDMDISERVATAMLYAIKSDTLFFARQTNRVDLDAFSHLYPLADAALIRKMEGADLSLDRLEYVTRAVRDGTLADQVFTAFLGKVPREDYITYAADFFLDLEDVRWTVISGVVNEMMVISVRNLGYSRNAGDFVKKAFGDIGSAGGHRAMAKAVVPIHTLRRQVRRHRPGAPRHADPLARRAVPARRPSRQEERTGRREVARGLHPWPLAASRRALSQRREPFRDRRARRAAVATASARAGRRRRRRPRRFGPLQLVAARAEHRIDELALGVLGAELDQLAQRLPAIGALVVGAVGVEQADGVVRRLDLDRRRRSDRTSAVSASRAADASAPAMYSASRARGSTARARSACGRSMATSEVTTITCSAPAADTSSSSRTIAAGRSQTRCASPRQKPAGSKRTTCGSASHGTASAAGNRVDDVPAAVAGQIDHFGPPLIVGDRRRRSAAAPPRGAARRSGRAASRDRARR